jgi:hypothetical protein
VVKRRYEVCVEPLPVPSPNEKAVRVVIRCLACGDVSYKHTIKSSLGLCDCDCVTVPEKESCTVEMPRSMEHARGMLLLAESYLKSNDPDYKPRAFVESKCQICGGHGTVVTGGTDRLENCPFCGGSGNV